MREKLTPAVVRRATEARQPVFIWDKSLPGFGLMVTANGHRSWPVQYRYHGKSRRKNLSGVLDLAQARKAAKAILGAAAGGKDPIGDEQEKTKAATNTLQFVHDEYFRRDGAKLRTSKRQRQDMERLVFPTLGKRPITEIKRSDIVRLLDTVEEERGAHMAEAILRRLSRLFTWHASRDDDFLSPIRRGMSRIKAGEAARDRVLSDDELRAIWRGAEAVGGPFGTCVRVLLLTATRRGEAAGMRWDEIDGTTWTVPAARMKGGIEHVVPLSAAARAIIESAPRFGPCVFSTTGEGPIAGFSVWKVALDKQSGVKGWRFHDLRRTAGSLLSRAGVAPDIAERALAHKITGIRGTYDRYAFYDEKRDALEKLAGLVDRIVNPTDNVVALRG